LAWQDLRNNWQRKSLRRERLKRKAPPEEPQSQRPRPSKDAATCAAAARQDVRNGLCASYEQALAVRLAIALGTDAAAAMARLSPRTGREALPIKKFARLVHPDKTEHPCAKEAFQRLAPALGGMKQ